MFDAVIVGGGPAGLSAALMLGRCRRNVLLCDSGQARNAASKAMHGFLTRDGISPAEFRQIAREQLKIYPNVECRDLAVIDAKRDGAYFNILLADHTQVSARTLLLATGLVDVLPAIPGIEQFYGTSVLLCPFCDGWELSDQPLALYNSGKEGVIQALLLTTWSRDVVLCTHGPSGLEARDRAMLKLQGVMLYEEPIARLEGTKDQLERIVFANGTVLSRRALFCHTQMRQTELLGKLGYDLSILAPPYKHPIAPGLFMAGDAYYSRWVSGAVGAGAEAAVMMHSALLEEEMNAAAQRATALQRS